MTFVASSVSGIQINQLNQATLILCNSHCPECLKPVGAWAKFTNSPPQARQWQLNEVMQKNEMLSTIGYSVTEVWPKKQVILAPAHLPDEITRVFIQAEGCAKRSNNDAAAVMYRRSIELSLKDKDAAASGMLGKRIDHFRDSGGITEDVAQWAHIVRLIANEAAHDPGEPTVEDVQDLASFTRVFLEYVYTLPEKVRIRLEKPKVSDTP